MNSKIIIGLLALVVLGVATWFFINREENSSESQESVYTFTNENGESINVSFNNDSDTATLNGMGYIGLVFERAVSGSDARYVNEENNMVLWNSGNEITLYISEEPVFTGVTQINNENNTDSSGDEVVEGIGTETESLFTSDDRLSNNVWVWEETRVDGGVIEPKEDGVFTLTFENDNVRGTTDCNGFFGPYNIVESNMISFGPLASTMMYCEGSQEAEFSGAVSTANRYSFTAEGNLILEGEGGRLIFSKK